MAAELLVVGVSHHTAPLSLRERLAVGGHALREELLKVVDGGLFGEGLLISTCNRIEIYGASTDPAAAAHRARSYLTGRVPDVEVAATLYERHGPDSVRHAFRVTSSLDSMVVGEPQILGQVKQAYEAAAAAGTIGTLLGRCFTRAFAVAKKVRSETGIAHGSVSVSSIAVELARKVFGDLHRRRVLLVGAGKMGEVAARNLSKIGAVVHVVNRSPERADQLASACGGEARGYEHLAQELVQADVVISSTGSDRFVVTHDLMREVSRARKHRPLFLIDIAVPRDVDPRVGDVDNVFLYDLDDLQQIATQNLGERRREAEAAERLVDEEVEQFLRWYRSLELSPTIVALRARFHNVVRAELERTMPRLSGMDEASRRAIDKMCDAMVNKLLHAPLTRLRESSDDPDGSQLIDAARRLFEIEPEGASESQATVDEPAEGALVELASASKPGERS